MVCPAETPPATVAKVTRIEMRIVNDWTENMSQVELIIVVTIELNVQRVRFFNDRRLGGLRPSFPPRSISLYIRKPRNKQLPLGFSNSIRCLRVNPSSFVLTLEACITQLCSEKGSDW